MQRSEQRRDKLRKLIKKADLQALLVTSFTNVTYLTGFTGDDSYLLVTPTGQVLVTDPRYTTQLEEECPGLDLEVRQPGVSMLDGLEKVLKKSKVRRLGIEANSMTVGLRDQLADRLPQVELVPTAGMVEELRIIKDKEELDAIRFAVWCAEKAFAVIRASLRPEQTEAEVAANIEHQIRLLGGTGCSFPPIVAVGPRAALPHARATDKKIGESDFVLIDWGAKARHYMSDLTRVLVTGKIPPKLHRIYGVVLNAQRQAIAAIKPGVSMHDVDAVARGIIAKAGFDKYFGHGLGHGIGLEIHESPRLGVNQKQLLRPGMVVTVEPGIYLAGYGGVRIEDDILVTNSGHEVLTSVAKDWDQCMVS